MRNPLYAWTHLELIEGLRAADKLILPLPRKSGTNVLRFCSNLVIPPAA